MKIKACSRLLLVLVVASLLLSACAIASRNALIGKWENIEQATKYEFTNDGRLRITSKPGVPIQEHNFRFVTDTQIEFIAPGSAGQGQPASFVITGDQLTLNMMNPNTNQIEPYVFTRIK